MDSILGVLSPILPYTSTALAIGLTLSPMYSLLLYLANEIRKTISEIKAMGSTSGVVFLPLFAIMLNGIMAAIYGGYIENTTVVLVNAINSLFGVYYVYSYYSYCTDNKVALQFQSLSFSNDKKLS